MPRLALFFLLLFTAFLCRMSPLVAQCVAEGRVADTDGQPVPFATVATADTLHRKGTVCDEQGRFSLGVPCADSVLLRVSATGYAPQTVAVYKHNRYVARCVLRQQATQLGEVTVTDQRNRAAGVTNIGVDKLQNTVGPSAGVESLLKTLPDVSSGNEMSSQYSVRGGSFDENLVYINHVEIYRPMLVRSGQQEGMSIINPDMVQNILFSAGGFDATQGDRMSSVLDITYSRPTHFRGSVSGSLLGAAAHAEGLIGQRATYSLGFRQHSNAYIFSSLDTKGAYTTSYTDLQALFSYKITDHLDLSLLGIFSRNIYSLIPESQTTTFGSFLESLELDVYFDGCEEDRYNTSLGALTLNYHPTETFLLSWVSSVQANNEQENYDIQSQFWLYELGLGGDSDVERFDRGVGTYLEHARNRLKTNIFSTELRGVNIVRLGSYNWGVKLQAEQIDDRVREWKWVDSAGYAMPRGSYSIGDSAAMPTSPALQLFCSAANAVRTVRLPFYVQRDVAYVTDGGAELKFVAGLRGQYYDIDFGSVDGTDRTSRQCFLSPRFNFSLRPAWRHDMLLRTAAGIYRQAPFYREFRRSDGTLNADIRAQSSYQIMETFDWNFRIRKRQFRLTADLYYKYLTDLIPYTIDNLRLRYDAENSATGYAAGLSVRLNGEFIEGLESWASLSLMRTQEDIDGDGLGYINRPTDQRLSVKLFFQDYLPTLPWWRMSISFIYGTGTPVTFPYQTDRSVEHRLPSYFRADWGNTASLRHIEKCSHWHLFRYIDDLQIGVEVFNLFNYRNVVSYIWVADYENTYYPVPNYLTARQINVKAVVDF